MPYYTYDAGFCAWCGQDMGLVEQWGGRNRRYCSNACKQKAYRARRKAYNVSCAVRRYAHLVREWRKRYGDAVADRLLLILENHGVEAARAAEDVAQVVIAELRGR